MTALGIMKLSERLRKLADYLDAGNPKVKRITLCCSQGEALAAGVSLDGDKLTYRGREVVLVPRGKL